MARYLSSLAAIAAVSLLAACAEDQPPPTEPTPRPVKTMVIAGADTAGKRSFPARIDAAQRAELAFRVGGTVKELPIKEGDRLAEGDLVARLDPTDFQIVVNDRQATFDKARKNFERGKELVGSGAISQVDFDQLEAEFKNAQAALETARQDLAYTELKAPFAGIVARRLVEQFEEVQPRQPIAALQNISRLEVKFDLPESVLRSVRAASEGQGGKAGERAVVVATFDDRPGVEYPLTFKEVATKADPQTQTFEVTFLMDQVDNGVVLPGMTASVKVDFGQLVVTAPVYTVPVGAVVGDSQLDARVWVVDEQALTVSPRQVTIGRLSGGEVEVLEGLEPGMRIVTAGAPFLADGMAVTLMPAREQAAPRPEDLQYQQ